MCNLLIYNSDGTSLCEIKKAHSTASTSLLPDFMKYSINYADGFSPSITSLCFSEFICYCKSIAPY